MGETFGHTARRIAPWQLVTVATFVVAAMHAVWAMGSSWPFSSPDELADTVVGRRPLPPAGATWVVVAVMAVTGVALLVSMTPHPAGGTLARLVMPASGAILTVATFILAMRGVLGLITSISGIRGSTGRYRVLDVFVYSPLTLWMAAGIYFRPHPAVGRTASPAAR